MLIAVCLSVIVDHQDFGVFKSADPSEKTVKTKKKALAEHFLIESLQFYIDYWCKHLLTSRPLRLFPKE